MDEVRYVSGGTSPPPPPAPSTPSKPAEKPKEEERKPETVFVWGVRTPTGAGAFGGGGWIGFGYSAGGTGRVQPIIQRTEPADPNKPEIKVEPQPDGVDVYVPVNTSREARQRFWGRAFGTPPAAIP